MNSLLELLQLVLSDCLGAHDVDGLNVKIALLFDINSLILKHGGHLVLLKLSLLLVLLSLKVLGLSLEVADLLLALLILLVESLDHLPLLADLLLKFLLLLGRKVCLDIFTISTTSKRLAHTTLLLVLLELILK